jgi:hypothetical protein
MEFPGLARPKVMHLVRSQPNLATFRVKEPEAELGHVNLHMTDVGQRTHDLVAARRHVSLNAERPDLYGLPRGFARNSRLCGQRKSKQTESQGELELHQGLRPSNGAA